MGVSTFLVGCLPTYGQVGMLAPILLVVLRLLQGLSAAGEQAGANSMSFEHAPDDRRGFFTSFTLSGTQGGQVLAPAVFLPLAAVLPDDQLAVVGLAGPVLDQRVMVVVGFIIRRTLDETPEFQAEAERRGPPGSAGRALPRPLAGVLRVFFAAFIATVNTMFAVFALNFATSDDTRSASATPGCSGWRSSPTSSRSAVIPLWARLSDRVGRKPVFVTGVARQRHPGLAASSARSPRPTSC